MKIWDVVKQLNTEFAEREEVIEGLVIALIARQHALLIGPPGTGKSALVTEVIRRITGAKHFQWLLTRFSTPEELFGPVSLQELEQGVYKRNTVGKLPEAHTSFLDEIFKANSAILNALLTLINERLFYNDSAPTMVPLISLVGSSNEYPEEGEGLEALFDRFLLRFEVNYIGEDRAFVDMLKSQTSLPVNMTMEDLYQLQSLSDTVTISDAMYDNLSQIRSELRDQGIQPSDRRFKQILSILRAKAVLAGRTSVVEEDLLILKHSLWEMPDQQDKVAKIIRLHAQDAIKTKVEDALSEVADVLHNLKKEGDTTDAALEAIKKIKSIAADLKVLQMESPTRLDIREALQSIQASLTHITTNVLVV